MTGMEVDDEGALRLVEQVDAEAQGVKAEDHQRHQPVQGDGHPVVASRWPAIHP